MNKPSYTDLENRIRQLEQENADYQSRLQHFDSLYSSMVEGVCLHELVYDDHGKPVDYRILDINPAYERITRIDREGAVGRLASDLYGSGEPPYLEVYAAVAESGTPMSFDTYFPPMDTYFSISVFSLEKDRFGTIFFDITERKRAEDELATIFTMSLNLICVADIKTNMFLKVNPAFTETLGFTEGELLGRSFAEFIHPEDLERTMRMIDEDLKKGRKVVNFENRHRCKSGGYRWLSWFSHPVPEKGLTYAVARDVTEAKQAAIQLQDSEQRFKSIIRDTEAGYFFIDKDGIIQDVNQAWVRMYKYESTDEVLGQHFTIIQKLEDSDKAKELVQGIMNGNRAYLTGEFSRKCKDGTVGYHTFSARPVSKLGEIVGIEGFIIDVTERKRLEEQLLHAQKMEAIGTLTGGIAHDFNNILSIIIGNTELALDDLQDQDSVRSWIEQIKRAGLRAKDVVQQLLSFSRKMESQKQPVQVGMIVKETLRLLRATIPTTIDIQLDVSDTAGSIMADPTQIHQLLLNLGTNAAHAVDHTQGIIRITLREIELDPNMSSRYHELTRGKYVRLRVSDNGCGMDAAVMDRIFDPYFTTKEFGKGTGLGLSIVHGIVKSHEGQIKVDSTPGEGTVVEILFPVTEQTLSAAPAPSKSMPKGSERILFVDDEISIAQMERQVLEKLGYRVEMKTDPQDALAAFQDAPGQFDLVITDMTMPKMNGLQLVEEVLKIRADIPIILCTGYSEKIDADAIAQYGIRKYINKPVRIHEIAKIVRDVLEGSRREIDLLSHKGVQSP